MVAVRSLYLLTTGCQAAASQIALDAETAAPVVQPYPDTGSYREEQTPFPTPSPMPAADMLVTPDKLTSEEKLHSELDGLFEELDNVRVLENNTEDFEAKLASERVSLGLTMGLQTRCTSKAVVWHSLV